MTLGRMAGAWIAAMCLWAIGLPSGEVPLTAQQGGTAVRIVSLVPAVTEMLFDMGAGPDVVAVSRYDTYPASVRALPKVGGLIDPDYERILRLAPTLVVTYASQIELERRLQVARIRYYSYRHGGIQDALDTVRDLGESTGRQTSARAAILRLETQLAAVRARVAGRARPRTLLVFGRERGTLRQVYASGGVGFEHEMLDVAGGRNVFNDVARESVQPSIEMMLARAPEAIVELHGSAPPEASVLKSDYEVWRLLSSVPAVGNGRVHILYADHLSIPGPRLGLTAEKVARALHPDAFQ
jgi:iron complex transport system substrate-binding protein